MTRALWALWALAAFVGWGGRAWDKAIPPDRAIPTLEAALQVLGERVEKEPGTLGLHAAELGVGLRDRDVVVVVEADALDGAAVAGLGGAVLHAAAEFGIWEVRIPVERLSELARVPGVRYVRRPSRPQAVAVTQGVPATGASSWHVAGHLGQGVRVAVIDLEFNGLAAATAAGELVHVVHVQDYTGAGVEGGGPHGVACAEIVQDMAPQAELILMKIDNEVQLARAVGDALALGARVITHSVAWFNTSFYDGTGVVCDIVRSATDRGVVWVNSAGNSADGAHWEGEWQDQDGDGLLDFAPGAGVNTFTAEAGVPIGIWLTWDGWPVTDQDYDLYLVQVPSGMVVASSTGTQAGGQPPVEQVFYVPPLSGTYGVVVRAHHAPQRPRLELFAPSRVKLRYSVASSSIPEPGNAPFVLTVGAIAASSWTTGPQAPYSSQGPTNRSRLNPVPLVKPDLMGPDRVDTLSYGPVGFPGTSASGPHVAGAAAVVWSANPTWTAAQVRAFLEGSALDMGAPGKDNVYGHGRLALPSPGVPPTGLSHTYGSAGWYLVSVPTRGDRAEIFGVPLYRWNGVAYEPATVLDPGHGYWARLPAGKVVRATGEVLGSEAVVALDRVGWHIVSAPWDLAREAIEVIRGGEARVWAEAVAAGWVRSTLWGYRAPDGGYRSAALVEAWYGYWLYARVDGLVLRLRPGGPPPPPPAVVSPLAPEEVPPPPPMDGGGLSHGVRCSVDPNPVTAGREVRFRVVGPTGSPVSEVRVRVYDLAGRLVWEGRAAGAELDWDTEDVYGRHLANGVYLYQVEARVAGEWMSSGLQKLAIYR